MEALILNRGRYALDHVVMEEQEATRSSDDELSFDPQNGTYHTV
jgi:hypothetical protein